MLLLFLSVASKWCNRFLLITLRTTSCLYLLFVQITPYFLSNYTEPLLPSKPFKDATNLMLSVGSLQAEIFHLCVQNTEGKVSGVRLRSKRPLIGN